MKNINIDSSKYSIVNVENGSIPTVEDSSNFIYLPYVMENKVNMVLSTEYDIFMKEYYEKHACCPKCGSKEYSTTLIGYVLDMDKKEDYKDLNVCYCNNCKDKHTMHDRIPRE
jgi:hypothetical protein